MILEAHWQYGTIFVLIIEAPYCLPSHQVVSGAMPHIHGITSVAPAKPYKLRESLLKDVSFRVSNWLQKFGVLRVRLRQFMWPGDWSSAQLKPNNAYIDIIHVYMHTYVYTCIYKDINTYIYTYINMYTYECKHI